MVATYKFELLYRNVAGLFEEGSCSVNGASPNVFVGMMKLDMDGITRLTVEVNIKLLITVVLGPQQLSRAFAQKANTSPDFKDKVKSPCWVFYIIICQLDKNTI